MGQTQWEVLDMNSNSAESFDSSSSKLENQLNHQTLGKVYGNMNLKLPNIQTQFHYRKTLIAIENNWWPRNSIYLVKELGLRERFPGCRGGIFPVWQKHWQGRVQVWVFGHHEGDKRQVRVTWRSNRDESSGGCVCPAPWVSSLHHKGRARPPGCRWSQFAFVSCGAMN